MEGRTMADYVLLLLSIPPKKSISSFMGCLKGKKALMIFDKRTNLKYKYREAAFLDRGILRVDGGIKRSDDPKAHSGSGQA